MDKKTVVNDANTAGKAIDAGKRVAAAIKQEIPVAWAAGKTKAMKFNQEIVRPKTEPVAKAILEKGVRPVLDKAIKAKNAAAQTPAASGNRTPAVDRSGRRAVRCPSPPEWQRACLGQ